MSGIDEVIRRLLDSSNVVDVMTKQNAEINRILSPSVKTIAERYAEISQTIDPSVKTITKQNAEISRTISPLAKTIAEQNTEISQGFGLSVKTIAERHAEINRILGPSVKTITERHAEINRILGSTLYENSQIETNTSLERAIKSERLIQSSLANFDLKEIGKLIAITNASRKSIFADFGKFCTAYSNLVEYRNSDFLRNFPAEIAIEKPAIEIFKTVNLLEVISVENSDSKLKEEKKFHRNENKEGIGNLEDLLRDIGAGDLATMWRGALDVLDSRHADYARHCSVSLRELLTQVIHKLAPDNHIRQWTNDPSFFDKNRPTRKARLLFICRSVNHDIFSDFVNKDIDAILAFFNLFQRGTHQVIVPYTHIQLLTLKAKIESTISFLIEVWKLNNV